jgi:hypothetical protein
MQYTHIRNAVWRPPWRVVAEEHNAAGQAAREHKSEALIALAKLVDPDEYEGRRAQWRLGLRDIWLDNGCVMTSYTPSGL